MIMNVKITNQKKNIQTFDLNNKTEEHKKDKKSIFISCGLFLSFIVAFQWLCNFSNQNKNDHAHDNEDI